MELRRYSLERYKGYVRRAEVEVAPLTILVGPNNSGKTALAQAIPLLAGGLALPDSDTREPLPLESCGIRHGESFEDLVTGRVVHGRLPLSITLGGKSGELSLFATVTNVVAPGRSSERQISDWRLQSNGRTIVAERQGFGESSDYLISVSGASPDLRPVVWKGLLPKQPHALAEWIGPHIDALETWAAGVRYLRCPRRLGPSPFRASERAPANIGPDGCDTPLALAADDGLRESVRDWYRKTFGVPVDIVAQGSYSDLVTGTPVRDSDVRIGQAGRGLSHVLPVVVAALSARQAGSGVDVIEHPEAELHPAAHADVAELLLENLAGPARPLIVETHSEMILLRARRWVAEGRLPARQVLVYWVHAEPERGSMLEKIEIGENGEMESWPDGVFIEDYEEILAIRRAARGKVKV
ncbi:MAG: hypothetical protein OXF27_12375 [Acidobacteria bacterium]|nr:hypothetical protein [Acidobacteriota bacterium]